MNIRRKIVETRPGAEYVMSNAIKAVSDIAIPTINVPADKIGAAAAEYLLAAIENCPNLLAPQIAVSLVVRGSTAPPTNRRN